MLKIIFHSWQSEPFSVITWLLRAFHKKINHLQGLNGFEDHNLEIPSSWWMNFSWPTAQTVRASSFVLPRTCYRQVGIEPASWTPLLQSGLSLLRFSLSNEIWESLPRFVHPGTCFPNLFDSGLCLSLGFHVMPTLKKYLLKPDALLSFPFLGIWRGTQETLVMFSYWFCL